MAGIFESVGYQVLVAENGAVALDRVREACPQLILLDMRMPVLDGMGFLKMARREGLCSATHIVLMTASQQFSPDCNVNLENVCELLVGPFELEELLAIAARYTRPPVVD